MCSVPFEFFLKNLKMNIDEKHQEIMVSWKHLASTGPCLFSCLKAKTNAKVDFPVIIVCCL
jgi:hypothetical protein